MKNINEFISRRSFLKCSAMAAAAPLILPRNLLGADAPSKKVSVGVIGCGRQTQNVNIPGFLSLDNCRVVAVCDVDAWRAEKAREKIDSHYAKDKESGVYKGCATFRDYRELLARSDIDAVFIGTPDHWHVPLSIAAMKAGKDVSCEKPLTLSIHEGRVLCDVAKKLKRVTRTDSEFRSSKLFHHAVECVRNGRIGNLKKIYTGSPTESPKPVADCQEPVPADFDFELWLGSAPRAPYCEKHVHPRNDVTGRPGWMLNRDYCEGMICNWGAHLNDIAQFAHGTDHTGPVEVEATGTYPAEPGFRNVLTGFKAHYRYADGVELDYKMDKPFIRLEGDEGWIEMPFGSPKLLASDPKLIAPASGANWKSFTRKQDKEDFVDSVLSREQTMEDFETGHRTISICQIAHIAIQLGGKKLKWDPVAEKFDNEDANKLLVRKSWRDPWKLDEA